MLSLSVYNNLYGFPHPRNHFPQSHSNRPKLCMTVIQNLTTCRYVGSSKYACNTKVDT